jgi:hypothetical protein
MNYADMVMRKQLEGSQQEGPKHCKAKAMMTLHAGVPVPVPAFYAQQGVVPADGDSTFFWPWYLSQL